MAQSDATALESSPVEYFPDPLPNTSSKSILRGIYCEPNGIHTILASVIKDNPDGGYPSNPEQDSQYNLWETGIQNWLSRNPISCGVPVPQINEQLNTATTAVQ